MTRRERDFWRRAVAEARQRLELTGHVALPGVRAEVHQAPAAVMTLD